MKTDQPGPLNERNSGARIDCRSNHVLLRQFAFDSNGGCAAGSAKIAKAKRREFSALLRKVLTLFASRCTSFACRNPIGRLRRFTLEFDDVRTFVPDPELPESDDYSKDFARGRRMAILAWFGPGGYAILTVIWTGKYFVPALRGPGFLTNLSLLLAFSSSILGLRTMLFFTNWKCPKCGEPFGKIGYRGPMRCQNCQLDVPRRGA